MVSVITDKPNNSNEEDLRRILEVGKILASVLTTEELQQVRSLLTDQIMEKPLTPCPIDHFDR